MTAKPVFISYARDTSADHARALHEALGEETAFLDTSDIETGERFPEALVDALFGARVVVIFAEPRYFTRWYCLLEFRIARTPFLRVVERAGATAREKADALRGLVVALPPRGVDPMMERFPPLVQGRNWPKVDEIERIAELVTAELAANPPTLRARYAAVADADAARSFLLEATRLPPPARIGAIPFVPQVGLPTSIADAFVGRADDLWRIHDLLWTERGDPATAAGLTGSIEAIGGFGKTRLALEYLYRFGPRHFKGGLFWINAESDAELQLYDVLQALNPSAPAIEHVRQGSGGVPGAVARAIRSRPEDAPTPLFIIDNVPEPAADQPPKPLETWCPVLGEIPVLTTSRTHVALGAGGGVIALSVAELDPASAVDLLATETPRAALEETEWREIAGWVGYLPLALEVLNRLLRFGEMTPRALLDLSRERRPSAAVDEAKKSIEHVVPPGALRGITEAFSASYNLLTPEEQYAARLIAWMAPAPVPAFVIDAFGPDVFPPGVRAKLHNRSFVAEVRDRDGAFYGAMHRVLADFVRVRAKRPVKEVRTVSSLLTKLMESVEGQGASGSALVHACAPLATLVFGHWITAVSAAPGFSGLLRACASLARSVFGQSMTRVPADLHAAGAFANGIGGILIQWGYPALADDILTSVTTASRRKLGEKHLATLSVMSNLGLSRCDRGDLAGAQQLQEHVLASVRCIRGEVHQDTLLAMNNLANTLYARGDYARAQESQEIVFEVLKRTHGDEHRETLRSAINLARVRWSRGDRAGAQELEEHVVEAMRRVVGDEHPDTLASMNNLALTRIHRGDYAEARELLEHVLKVRRRIFGDEHPDTLSSILNLALALRGLGEFAKALELQEHVLAAMRRILGDEHPTTLTSMSNLADLRSEIGDYEEARELKERVLAASRRILGDEHPSTLSAMYSLALTRHEQRDHAGAQELQERVVEASRRILGDEHPDTLSAMNALALARRNLGDHVGAQGLQELVVEASRRRLGDEHPDTLYATNNLADTRRELGDHAGAQELQEHVLESMRKQFGPKHPRTAVAAYVLLQIHIAQDDSASADRLLRDDLHWLLDSDPVTMTEQQRRIRAELRKCQDQLDRSADQE